MENLLTGVIVVSSILLVLLVLNIYFIGDLFYDLKKSVKDYKSSVDNKLTCIDAFNYNSKHDFQSFVNLSNDRFDNSIENLDYLQSQICDLQTQIDKIKKSRKR